MNDELIQEGVKLILVGIGCDLHDRNYFDTPARVARMYKEVFHAKSSSYPTFEESYADFILLRRHVVWSFCPHHLLPVRLETSIAYIPNDEVVGLSKLARVLDSCNTKPVLQEAYTREVVRRLSDNVRIHGSACYVSGNHGCMQIRGVRTGGDVVTTAFAGKFRDDQQLQDRFLAMVLAR